MAFIQVTPEVGEKIIINTDQICSIHKDVHFSYTAYQIKLRCQTTIIVRSSKMEPIWKAIGTRL